MTERIFRRPDVEAIVGLGRSTIYDLMARGLFPRPVRLGDRAVGWRESDIHKWLESRKTTGKVA
jgi:prophage regulatory protein